MKSLQFELWQECSQQCKFCYLGAENKNTPKERKLHAMQQLNEKISESGIFDKYDNISLIGGEFFQGQMSDPDVRQEFFLIAKRIHDLLASKKITSSWVSATLTRPPSDDLIQFLEMFKDIQSENPSDGMWIITSYDAVGRFHTPEQEAQWHRNMKFIRDNYPSIHLNTTVILTQRMTERILSGGFDFREFAAENGTNLFFKQPGPGSYGEGDVRKGVAEMEAIFPGFFPKRKDFLTMLKKIGTEWPEYYQKLFNIKFRADDLFRNYNYEKDMRLIVRHKNARAEMEENPLAPCGHVMDYSTYLDSDHCILCDKLALQDFLF